jgi:hypothetical protein
VRMGSALKFRPVARRQLVWCGVCVAWAWRRGKECDRSWCNWECVEDRHGHQWLQGVVDGVHGCDLHGKRRERGRQTSQRCVRCIVRPLREVAAVPAEHPVSPGGFAPAA